MMLKQLIKLCRPQQWYKNLVIFLPIIFAQKLFDLAILEKTFLGLIALCLISSANYVINDIADIERDKRHPEKKFRPLASGKVKVWQAIILAFILFPISIYIAINLSLPFLYIVLFLFLFTQLYSFWLKKEAFVDILCTAINFVTRAVAGAFVITIGILPYTRISPWLIVVPFFLSLFLSLGKREADLRVLGEKALLHKKVLNVYNKDLIRLLMAVVTALLIISYSLYSFLSISRYLLLTLPFALYTIFRYLYLIESGSVIARRPEFVVKDKRMVVGMLAWLIAVLLILYL